MLAAFLTTILFAVSGVAANRTSRLLGGTRANFWRISLATLLLALWAHTAGSGLTGRALPYFLVSGCVGFGLGDVALYQALPRLGSRLSILLVHCLAAPFAALLEWLWLGTVLTPLQIGSSLTILAGVAIALAPSEHLSLSKSTLLLGISFGVLAAFGQGCGAVLSRKAYQVATAAGEHTDGLTAAYQRILAGWLIGAITYYTARWLYHVAANRANGMLAAPVPWGSALSWVLINALAGPTLGVGCYQWALANWPTGVVLPIVATTPIVVIPLAMLVERERPGVRSLAGGAIAVLGAVLLAAGSSWLPAVRAHWP